MCLTATSQTFEQADIEFSVDGNLLNNALLGGLNRPLIDVINLDSDEDLELVVFDIDGSVVLTFEWNKSEWQHTPELSAHFPPLFDWVFFRDFNKDGIIDIFTQAANLFTFGIQVYEGFHENGVLKFNQVELDEDQYNLLHYLDVFSNQRYIPVSPTNFPAIEDFDGDGDLDVLTFNPGGFYAEYYQNLSMEEGLDPSLWKMEQGNLCWGNFFETGNAEGVILNNPCDGLAAPVFETHSKTKAHGSAGLAAFDRDADGDLDVVLTDVARDPLIYLENGGTAQFGNITSQETNFPSETTMANPQRMGYPSFADINLDGKEDMLVAPAYFSSENIAVCWHYQNVSEDDSYSFELIEKDWMVKDMIDLGKGSDPTFVDFNGDELLDIVVGTTGYYLEEGGFDARVFLFTNVGSASDPAYELTETDLFGFNSAGSSSWGFSPSFGDLDGDGDWDCLIGDFNGALHYFENNAGAGNPMSFEEGIFPFMEIDTEFSVGQNATPIIFDLNDDGRGDILMGGDRGLIRYFENQGAELNEVHFDPDPTNSPNVDMWGGISLQIPGAEKGYSAPTLIEQDNGLHFFSGSEYGSILRYEAFPKNDVPEDLILINENYGNTKEGQFVRPDFADIDADGFLEMVVGNQRGGIAIYETDFFLEGLGVDDFDANAIHLFPNPVQDLLNIEGEESIEGVRLYDTSGKLLLDLSGDLSELSLKEFHPGLYFLEILTNDGRSITNKILKQ